MDVVSRSNGILSLLLAYGLFAWQEGGHGETKTQLPLLQEVIAHSKLSSHAPFPIDEAHQSGLTLDLPIGSYIGFLEGPEPVRGERGAVGRVRGGAVPRVGELGRLGALLRPVRRGHLRATASVLTPRPVSG